jgi:glucokinase
MITYHWVPTLFMPKLESTEEAVAPFFLFFDVGGTKVLAEILDSRGRIVESDWKPAHLSDGPLGLLKQIVDMGTPLLGKYKVDRIEVSSAGPLDPTKGLWVSPTNLKTDGKHWGTVDVLSPLRRQFGVQKISLENDAAAQAQLMHKYHPLAKSKDFLLLTLGTGVGVAIIKNGKLVRTAEGLHPELSHVQLYNSNEISFATPNTELQKQQPIKFWNQFADHPKLAHPRLCGCGVRGCMETYMAGSYFVREFAEDLQKQLIRDVFLPRTAGRLCDEYGVASVFVSGNFGKFLS